MTHAFHSDQPPMTYLLVGVLLGVIIGVLVASRAADSLPPAAVRPRPNETLGTEQIGHSENVRTFPQELRKDKPA